MYEDIRTFSAGDVVALAGNGFGSAPAEVPLGARETVERDIERFLTYSRVFHDAHRYTNDGPLVKLLERRLAARHGRRHCIAHANGFWGLVLAIECLALPGRRRVVLAGPANRRLADAVAWCGLWPSFVEADGTDLGMTTELAACCVDPQTALILGIHPLLDDGSGAGLQRLAARNGVPLLLDAAESAFESVAGRQADGFVRAECFSMHTGSPVEVFDGGYVTTDDARLAHRLSKMRGFGYFGQDNIEHLGLNAKLNEVHAALALARLDRLEDQAAHARDRHGPAGGAVESVPTIRGRDGAPGCARPGRPVPQQPQMDPTRVRPGPLAAALPDAPLRTLAQTFAPPDAPLRPLAQTFALFGAAPALDRPLPVGQLYFPSWERYEAAMRDLVMHRPGNKPRRNVRRLEARLAERMRVRHAICVSNATIGLIMACEALGLTGKVIVPSFTFIATPQALSWSRLTPVFCDVEPTTHQVTATLIEPLIDADVSAILAVNLWGDACPAAPLQALADRHGIRLFFDSAHAMGCEIDGVPVGNFGALEVFSFHATKAFSSAEGGCITTNDDVLAARLRRIRGPEGAEIGPSPYKSGHGCMSEAQAAIGLLNLDEFDTTLARNQAIFARYRRALAEVPGITLYEAANASKTNHQYVVCEVDETCFGLSRDLLLGLLKAEHIIARRYFYPGSHRSVPYLEELPQFVDALPCTDRLNARLFQLPTGALVTDADIESICACIATAHRRAEEIRAHGCVA